MQRNTQINHFYQQQQAVQARYMRRLEQFSAANQAATLLYYNRSFQLVGTPDGGTRNTKPANNSSQAIGGVLPLVSQAPNGVFVSGR